MKNHGLELYPHTFQRHKIAIQSLAEKLDTSSYVGLFVVHILGALAEMERQMIVSRTKDALAHLKKNGRRISRYSPFGYDFDEEGTDLIPNLSEQRTVNLVMDSHKEGLNYSEIARKLKRLSVPSRTNDKWHPEQVRRLIYQFNEGVGS